jgi:hypothetical protein
MNISIDDWNGFIPISFTPGLGGEFFAHLLHYRHEAFKEENFPFNNTGKFSYVNEEKPLVWNSDKSLFGWFLKSDYKNTPADHDTLVNRMKIANDYSSLCKDIEKFDRLSFSIAVYTTRHSGSLSMNVFDDIFIKELSEIYNANKNMTIQTYDYKIAVVHPSWRWFRHKQDHPLFNNAKAIQLYCDPKKGWLFWLLVFNKMYYYYLEYVKAGETFRKKFFDNLEENFIDRVDNKYAVDFCNPFERQINFNLNVDSYSIYFEKKDHSHILSEYLEQDFTIPKKAIDYYYDINTKIIKHFELDHTENFVAGKDLYNKFMKHGPYEFKK